MGIPLVFPYFAGSNLVPFPQDVDLSKNPNSGINQVWESVKLRKLGSERIFAGFYLSQLKLYGLRKIHIEEFNHWIFLLLIQSRSKILGHHKPTQFHGYFESSQKSKH